MGLNIILIFALACVAASQASVIDVSHHNGDINWSRVKQAGVTLAIAKVSEGASNTDKTFQTNWNGIKAQGIQGGAYHYLRGSHAVQDQVKNIKTNLQKANFGRGDMLVIDVEETGNSGVSKDQMANTLQGVLDGLKDTYTNLWIYTAYYFWEDKVAWRSHDFSKYKLWVAHYTKKDQPLVPNTWKSKGYSLWQYTDKGRVDGINGNVDMSRF